MSRVRRLVVSLFASGTALLTVAAASPATASAAVVPSSVLGPPQAVVTADGNFQLFSENGQGWGSLGVATSNPPDAVYGPDGNNHVVITSGAGAAIDWFAHYAGVMSGWQPLQ